MPDASGNFKGISVPELPWEVSDKEMTAIKNCASLSSPPPSDRSKLSGADATQAALENSQGAEPTHNRAWNEATLQALRQTEQDR